MRTLLILTCSHDVQLTRRMLRRISRLGGWQYFNRLHLHLDSDVPLAAAKHLLLSATPLSEQFVHISQAEQPCEWRTDRARTMLQIYKQTCRYDADVIRLDPDVYIASPLFFESLTRPYRGIAGKLMPLYLPATVLGRQLDFIQGGVSLWGPQGRRYLEGLNDQAVQAFKDRCLKVVNVENPKRQAEYEYFFLTTEDVVLTGAMAIVAGIERTNIPRIQVSSYDVMRDYRSERWTYADFIDSYRRSGALAYHFEGAHDGRRARMTEMLHQFYREQDGDE
jgi:hypothetical protein